MDVQTNVQNGEDTSGSENKTLEGCITNCMTLIGSQIAAGLHIMHMRSKEASFLTYMYYAFRQ